MAMTREVTLSVQIERLRALFTLLAFAQDGQRHDELLEQARTLIADVRKTRAALAERDGRPVPNRHRPGLLIDYSG